MASIISAGTSAGTALNLTGDTSGQLALATNNGTTALTIDTSQNVGIGTTSPAAKLDIAAPQGIVRNTSTTGTNAVDYRIINTGGTTYFGRDDSTGSSFGTGAPYATVMWSSGAYPTVFAVNSTERMRIASNGNIGIGTNNPGAKLDVNGTILGQNFGSGGTALQLNDNTGSAVNQFIDIDLAKAGGAYNYFKMNFNNAPIITWGGALSSYTNNLSLSSPSGSVIFNSNGTERMRINAVGSREFTNYANGTYNTGEATITYSNVSSTTFDVSTLFPSVSGTGSCVGLVIHINNWTGNNSSVVSAIWNGYRASTGWSFTSVSNLNAGASASISISGSGNIVTITFGFGGIYGKAKISLIATS